jgi:hypothetical protein
MNAVKALAAHLSPPGQRFVATVRRGRFDRPAIVGIPGDLAGDAIVRRFGDDLCELLNHCRRQELAELACGVGVPPAQDLATLRLALWRWGACLEAGGSQCLGTALQPIPAVVAGRLVIPAAPRGAWPRSPSWPRPVPAPAPWAPPDEEPDTLDDLLAAADRALGVRLGVRGADKGAWGGAAARLLGVVERGAAEPDWRGDVEIKTVPVERDASGWWRISEDPAVSMMGASPRAKLQRVLWLVRAPLGDGDSTLLSWNLVDWDGQVAELVDRYLHTRPKGPAGTSHRGWYLHKRFFTEVGLWATLNGARAAGATGILSQEVLP